MLNAILPLISLDGSMYAACSYIRKMASSPGTGITSAAMTAACVIVLFTMIKLSHDLMSDEQQSGFGGVTLWQICRPIVILLAIFNFNLIDSVVNGVCNYVSASVNLSADIDDISERANRFNRRRAEAAALGEEVMRETYEETGVTSTDEMTPAQKAEYNEKVAMKRYGAIMENGNGFQKGLVLAEHFTGLKGVGDMFRLLRGAMGSTITDARVELDDNGNVTDVKSMSNSNDNWVDKSLYKLGNMTVSNLVLTIYKYVFPMILIGGELLLCVLVFFGPWSLVFSLLPWSRNTFTQFIMTYLQICCWKPIASIVNWATVNAMDWAISNEVTPSGFSRSATASMKSGQVDFLLIVIALAGIKTMMSVPSIASSLIPGGGQLGGSGGGGTAIAAGVLSEVKNAPGKAFGMLTGGKGKK